MAYSKTTWENLPSTNTPINANNLNKIENQIAKIDNIVTSGSNSNGNYVKFADGTMICFARVQIPFSVDIQYGSAYRGDIQQITLPATFKNTGYRVHLQPLAPVHVCYLVDDDKNTSSFKFYPVSFVQQSASTNRSIDYIAIGKWE